MATLILGLGGLALAKYISQMWDQSAEISDLNKQIKLAKEHQRMMERTWKNQFEQADEYQRKEMEAMRERMNLQKQIFEQELERVKAIAKREKKERERRRDERLNYAIPDWLESYVTDVEDIEGKKLFINIGIVGGSGVGKSKFINTIRGYSNMGKCSDVDECAKVGVMETTILPKPFEAKSLSKNLDNRKVILWDLPGVGTSTFPSEDYFKTVGLRHFDMILLMSSGRFSEDDLKLKKELERVKLPFFFIRTKVDMDVQNNADDNGIQEDETLRQIRDNSHMKGIKQIFLVSSKHEDKYDLPVMVAALKNETVFSGTNFT